LMTPLAPDENMQAQTPHPICSLTARWISHEAPAPFLS
jgi:hypothetical protein